MSTNALDASSQALSPGLIETLFLLVSRVAGAVEFINASRSSSRSSVDGAFFGGGAFVSCAHARFETRNRAAQAASPIQAFSRTPTLPAIIASSLETVLP